MPNSFEEYARLDDYDLDLLDFPIHYKIAEEGDYYHDPSIPEDKITWQYTVVDPDFIFPNIQYEVLEELIIPPYESYLTAEAFRLTETPYEYGLKSDGDGGTIVFNPTVIDSGNPSSCTPDCISYPCCLVMPDVSCDDDGFDIYDCQTTRR